jgi:hypothetical protein
MLGCASEPSEDQGRKVTWEEFEISARRQVGERTIYVVEWDQAVSSREELRAYYDRNWGPDGTPRLAGTHEGGDTTTTEPLIVNQVGGVDDVWTEQQTRNMTYCVSTSFGASFNRAVTEMQDATSAWMAYVDARFSYDSSQDSNCVGTNTNVTFAVAPWTSGGACAFFPSGAACVPRTLVIDFNDFDTNPSWPILAPNLTTTGVFRHELGHILGFRHEHTRPESGTCFEDSSWRALTDYDAESVMHYQWCNGVLLSDLSLTTSDVAGAIRLHGMSAALFAPIL